MSNLQVWNCSLHSKILDHNRTYNSQKNSQQPKLDFFGVFFLKYIQWSINLYLLPGTFQKQDYHNNKKH